MGKNDILYDFRYGEQSAYNVFPARDIELVAEERPGIYSWHIRVLPKGIKSEDIKAFCNVMASKSYNVNFASNLKDQFKGKAKKEPLEMKSELTISSFLNTVTTVLCPPIYIGISKGVKTRLTTHKNTLLEFLDKRVVLLADSGEGESDTSFADDTELESSKFAQRVGKALADNGIFNEAPLFLKVIYLDDITREELRQCESFVNRNFHPLFGLR